MNNSFAESELNNELNAVQPAKYSALSVWIAACICCATATLHAQIHKPDEILKILEESPIAYAINLDEETKPVEAHPPQIPPVMYRLEEAGKVYAGMYELSEEVGAVYEEAENLFAAGKYDSAILSYHNVLEMRPDFSTALTMTGDAYIHLERYDSAQHYLQAAIELNFLDYQAHWFLATTLMTLGKNEEGLHQLTIAHILNPGHALLKRTLIADRSKHAPPWEEWSFAPRYELKDESLEEVTVRCAPGWMMYAITHALWEFEENYTAEMGVEDPASLVGRIQREYEATLMFAFEYWTRQEKIEEEKEDENTEEADAMGKRLEGIMKDKMLEHFIFYESIAKKTPQVIMQIDPKFVEGVALYLDKYH